jgi:hypothetical protein
LERHGPCHFTSCPCFVPISNAHCLFSLINNVCNCIPLLDICLKRPSIFLPEAQSWQDGACVTFKPSFNNVPSPSVLTKKHTIIFITVHAVCWLFLCSGLTIWSGPISRWNPNHEIFKMHLLARLVFIGVGDHVAAYFMGVISREFDSRSRLLVFPCLLVALYLVDVLNFVAELEPC